MYKIRLTPSIIPNMFTAMNMFSGFLSIIFAADGNYFVASWLIIIAAVFDALDGAMARLTKSCSEIGVELDSLSDAISFGTAPAFLIYSAYFHKNPYFADNLSFAIIISSLLMISGGFRLARFNVQLTGFDKAYFKGLPIPSSGIAIAAFILAYYDKITLFGSLNIFVIPLILVLSYLMVSNIKYDTAPKLTLKGIKEKPFFAVILFLSLVMLFFSKSVYVSLFFFFIFMILFGIIRYVFSYFQKIFAANK
ncbi:MAG: CDP-diacylglycerol--serine O-phosphatidyltransferase [Bacteroidota bacterium]|nr:CDP-diacylglycerol--serine O-phosphatidyltransferase [Bacteroidota bacterium]